jgi:mono/diheme cytochrome c family protein
LIHFIRRGSVVAAILCSLIAASAVASQTRTQTTNDGVYTDEQATRGLTVYRARCSTCHGAALDGRSGPPLTGNDFMATWSAQPLLDLANKIRRTMPKADDGPRLTPAQTSDLVAYLLQVGKFPAGRSELPSDEAALKQLTFSGQASAQPKTATFAGLPPSGNVGQVMRGILFPSANIIFAVQSIDPGVKRAVPTDQSAGFDWFTWGMAIYPGWEVVDYAAVSLSESATLMLMPGRKCENGRAVPVSDPDWIKFTMELADAGKASYKASQTRNQELVSDSTNQLNDSCMNCHRVFRGRTHCVKP